MSQMLVQSTKLAQQGRISQGIASLQVELERIGDDYGIYSNLAAFYLQLGEVETSIEYNSKAILLDPFCYIAYYNRFLCYFAVNKLKLAWSDLQKSLSCLYLLKGYEQNNLKLVNKAISYCQQNARAYLVRAKYNQGKNNKLADNDYSNAIEYAPNLVEIYQQRALFYRRIGKTRQFEQNLESYKSLLIIGAKHTTELAENECEQMVNYRQQILVGAKQFRQLLSRPRGKDELTQSTEELISKLPLDSVQSKIEKKDEEELLLSDRPQEENTGRTLQIRKEDINFRKRPYQDRLNKNFQQIFQDQNSKELNDEIQKLQKQIKAEGGKLTLEECGQIDAPSNFLTAEIERAIQQLALMSNRDQLNDVKSVKSANSNGSLGSKGQNKQITVQQFKRYRKFILQINSLQDLDDPDRNELCKIIITYRNRQLQTSMGRFVWEQKFDIPIDFDCYEVDIQAIQKGGVFKPNAPIGEGSINLLEVKQSKCILGSKDKKTAILHYKLALI